MHDAGRLAGKVAIVTGGASGIGAATVRRFLDEGASVVVADLDTVARTRLMEQARDAGVADRLRMAHCDVADEDSVAAVVDGAVAEFGQLDCMFNNAAIAPPAVGIEAPELAGWRDVFAVDLFGVLHGIRHAARVMKLNADGGSIINTASIAALSARSGTDAYSAAKAAVVNLTLSAAVKLAPARIRVNAISPGPILTDMVIRLRGPADQLRRIMELSQPWPEHGRPEFVAAAALFLASDDSRFVVGHNLVVDGGMMAAGPRYGDRTEELRQMLDRDAESNQLRD